MTTRDRQSVGQLDFLRGIAISLMIVNHVGTTLSSQGAQASPALAALIFIGSFAPVIFFFTTGFGVGIAKSEIHRADILSTLIKAGLLIVADQFLFWRIGEPWGLDFLGFIALSSVLVTLIAATRRPIWLCASIASCVLILRFVFGAWFRDHADLPGLATWLAGARGIDRVSYPFSPWIVFPLLGLALTKDFKASRAASRSYPGRWTYIASAAALASAAGLFAAHAVFFRWGTMSFAYFILSIGVVLLALVAAWRLSSLWPQVARVLSLRGISSLAIVPIHYALIELIGALAKAPLNSLASLGAMGAVILGSIAISRLFATRLQGWLSTASPTLASISLTGIVVAGAAVCWYLPRQPLPLFCAFIAGQLAVTALLAIRNRSTIPLSSPKPALS